VKIYLSDKAPPAVPPTLTCRALEQLPPSNHTEVASHKDIVLTLADLWGVESDTVRRNWACAFFAAGLGDKGTEVPTTPAVTNMPCMLISPGVPGYT